MIDLFKASISPSGGLRCDVDGDGRTLWMYLVDIDSEKVLCDAPICSHVPLTPLDDFKKTYSGNGAPPLVESFTSKSAVLPSVELDSIDIQWEPDEAYVDVLIDSKAISRIVITGKTGLSIFTLKEGPWGEPWVV